MAEYRTQDQVEAYLARIFNPDRQFRLYPFEGGWLVQSILTSEERDAGMGLGMTSLVIDADTGVVTEYPSWSGTMIVENFQEAKRTGRPSGRRIYPPRWRLSAQRTLETPETINYRVQVQSLATPPEGDAEYEMTIDKNTLKYQPHEQGSAGLIGWAEWKSRESGTWPEQRTWEE